MIERIENYTLQKFDDENGNRTYKFTKMAFSLRNIPVPLESKPITPILVRIANFTPGNVTEIGRAYFTFTPQPVLLVDQGHALSSTIVGGIPQKEISIYFVPHVNLTQNVTIYVTLPDEIRIKNTWDPLI